MIRYYSIVKPRGLQRLNPFAWRRARQQNEELRLRLQSSGLLAYLLSDHVRAMAQATADGRRRLLERARRG